MPAKTHLSVFSTGQWRQTVPFSSEANTDSVVFRSHRLAPSTLPFFQPPAPPTQSFQHLFWEPLKFFSILLYKVKVFFTFLLFVQWNCSFFFLCARNRRPCGWPQVSNSEMVSATNFTVKEIRVSLHWIFLYCFSYLSFVAFLNILGF